MRNLCVLFSTVSFLTFCKSRSDSSDAKDIVNDVEGHQKLSDGMVSVTCTKVLQNGKRSFVITKQVFERSVDDKSICRPDWNPDGTASNDGPVLTSNLFYCQPYNGGMAAIALVANNQEITNRVQLETCQNIIKNSYDNYFCNPSNNEAYLTFLQGNNALSIGNRTSVANCINVIKTRRGRDAMNLMCVPGSNDQAQLSNVVGTTNNSIGNQVPIADCIAAVKNAKKVFCGPASNGNAYIYERGKNSTTYGNQTALASCMRAVDASTDDYYCQPASNDNFTLTKMAGHQNLGGSVTLDQCIKAIPAPVRN